MSWARPARGVCGGAPRTTGTHTRSPELGPEPEPWLRPLDELGTAGHSRVPGAQTCSTATHTPR
eukprot:2109417-Prymnesium_polylepis.1